METHNLPPVKNNPFRERLRRGFYDSNITKLRPACQQRSERIFHKNAALKENFRNHQNTAPLFGQLAKSRAGVILRYVNFARERRV